MLLGRGPEFSLDEFDCCEASADVSVCFVRDERAPLEKRFEQGAFRTILSLFLSLSPPGFARPFSFQTLERERKREWETRGGRSVRFDRALAARVVSVINWESFFLFFFLKVIGNCRERNKFRKSSRFRRLFLDFDCWS